MAKLTQLVVAMILFGIGLLIVWATYRLRRGFAPERPIKPGKRDLTIATAIIALTAFFVVQMTLVIYSGHHPKLDGWSKGTNLLAIIFTPLVGYWQAHRQVRKRANA